MTTYSLPFDRMDAKGFTMLGNKLFVLQHSTRTLYAGSPASGLMPVEEMTGRHISDVVVLPQGAIYCSRNRTLRKVAGETLTQTIPGTSNLVSIASDGRFLYLLDASEQPSILTMNSKTGKLVGRFAYDGIRPVDIAVGKDGIYVLDMGDRCVHHLDARTKRTKSRIQVGPGIAPGCGGIVWLGDELYVHEAEFNRLRPLRWTVDGTKVASWTMPLKMTLTLESRNESTNDTTLTDFTFSVPPSDGVQAVEPLEWSSQPDEVVDDRFGESIARFQQIEIAPQSEHRLSYQTTVVATAAQYDPPRLPLARLNDVPQEIKDLYLAPDPIYDMASPSLITAAKIARLNSQGTPASDVRTLIENIVHYLSLRLSYEMDDTWDHAADVIERGTGSCSEYSFLFSSLCRLNGIPTRLVGGVQVGDYLEKHDTDAFHRWTEVYFPEIGWIPVDATKYDDSNDVTRDVEFLFGTPGYLIKLSQGGIDEEGLGAAYYVKRHYRGGKRTRRTIVSFEPANSDSVNKVVLTIR